MEKDLTKGNPFMTIFLFSLPIIGGNLFQLVYTLADTVIVGRTLGSGALAAVGSTGIISYFLLCFIQGFTGGFGICLGQSCGARNESAQRQCAALSWALSVAFTLIITPAACLLTVPLLTLLKTPTEILDSSFDYLFVILLGTGATIYYNMISNMLRALGDSRTPLVFLIVLGLLSVIRATVQSMGNSTAPFAACIVELAVRIGATFGLSQIYGYTGICLSTPLAWFGAVLLLLAAYRRMQ